MSIFKKAQVAFLASLILLTGFFIGSLNLGKNSIPSKPPITVISKPLEKYTIENLSKKTPPQGTIEITETLEENDKYTANLFYFTFDPTLEGKKTKRLSGQINRPSNNADKHPLIVMLRGYVDQKLYQTGVGTRKAAAYFSENGFITISPDFLGYGQSDKEADDIFEARFQTYTTVLSLLQTIKNGSLPQDIKYVWDGKNILLWGHSNGGQIALTILEITGADYPTTLWAPVSKPFPYSIIYYTDESDDRGKFIRSELAKFEAIYDVEAYSLTNYLDRIKAPLQIHQGTSDDAVPKDWSDELAKILLDLNADLGYYIYPGVDHNLTPGWNTAVMRDLVFFKKQIK